MVRYVDWVQTVLRVVLQDRPAHQRLTLQVLAADVGLPLDGLPESRHNEVVVGLDHVLRDLAQHGLVLYQSDGHSIGHSPAARRFGLEPLTSIWSELRSGFLEADDEAFLGALASLSERPGPDLADVAEVRAEDVFADLGWTWDASRAVAIYGHLKDCIFVEGRIYGGPAIFMRVTYAGLVRVLDDAGALLREAEDHFQAHRLRAAGCIAAVELERRLKQLVGRPKNVSRRRDPSLEDYNKAAYDAGIIDQETWQSISTLAVIRKRCVHVLEREPASDEVRLLVEGTERVLRRYPAA